MPAWAELPLTGSSSSSELDEESLDDSESDATSSLSALASEVYPTSAVPGLISGIVVCATRGFGSSSGLGGPAGTDSPVAR